MSIRSARRSIDPSIALPPAFRTLSYGIEEEKRRSVSKHEKISSMTSKSKKQDKKQAVEADFGDIDYHLSSVEELFRRFSSSRNSGISTTEAANQLKTVGRNLPSPPPSRWFKQTVGYLFGGFGSILFIASILVFIAWKPLGNPDPAVANLALAIVLVAVWIIQAGE
jgi:sodium/potassium-transporting ATPase subunit alpha